MQRGSIVGHLPINYSASTISTVFFFSNHDIICCLIAFQQNRGRGGALTQGDAYFKFWPIVGALIQRGVLILRGCLFKRGANSRLYGSCSPCKDGFLTCLCVSGTLSVTESV